MSKRFHPLRPWYKKIADEIEMYLEHRNMQKKLTYQVLYGTVFTKDMERGWYNPLRYIVGKEYEKVIAFKDVDRFVADNEEIAEHLTKENHD